MPYTLVLPAAILLVGLSIITSAYGVFLSFLDFSYLRVAQRFSFVGLAHYHAIFRDPLFWTAARHTAIWSVTVVPGAFLLGLYVALLLNIDVKAKWFFRTAVLLPWAVPLVVVGVLWSFILAPAVGPVDDLLFRLGSPQMKYMNWLGNINFAFPITIGVQIWRTTPFFAITLLAGLQAIPGDLYDAAEIDGAAAIRRFCYITLPLLRSVAAVVFLQGLIWSFFNFTLVFVMTGGGPANSSEILTTYLWRQAFPAGEVGKGAAVGTTLVLALSVLGTLWVLRMIQHDVTA